MEPEPPGVSVRVVEHGSTLGPIARATEHEREQVSEQMIEIDPFGHGGHPQGACAIDPLRQFAVTASARVG